MLKAGVTIACAAAMLVAVGLVVWLRHTRRTPSPLCGTEPFGERLAVTVARTGGMLVGAYLAGILALGAGIRLMMRVIAATSADDAQGRFTEADEIVGKVNADGSLFLIVIAGLATAIVGLALYSILRRWLPDSSLAAGLIGVAIGGGMFVRPVELLDSSNSDFELLTPVILAVAMILATLVLFGLTFGVLVDHLAPRWPRPGRSVGGVASVLPFVVLVLSPPVFVAVALGVLVGTVAPQLRPRMQRDQSPRPEEQGRIDRVGRILVVALGAVGGVSIAVAVGQILAL